MIDFNNNNNFNNKFLFIIKLHLVNLSNIS